MNLITLAQARAQIRSDETVDDAYVEGLIAAVSASILNYVDVSAYVDSSGTVPVDSAGYVDDVPEPWRLACQIEVARMYRYRENDAADHVDPSFGYGYPFGKTAMGLLFPYRMPSLA